MVENISKANSDAGAHAKYEDIEAKKDVFSGFADMPKTGAEI